MTQDKNTYKPKVSIIIPAWNLWELTKPCLESLAAHTPQELRVEVLVVDNNSTDATKEALAPTLQTLFGEFGHSLRLPENMGFAKACNAGAAKAQGELLFFLNNDTLLTKNWLPPLIQALENTPKLGMVGPLLLYPSERVQHLGIGFSPSLELVHLYHLFPQNHSVVRKKRNLQAITGAALLLPAKLFQDCGGFFTEYINGFEDLDLCCAIRQKGLNLTCIAQSCIYHITSQTPGRFDHDGPNAALLTKRRQGMFKPDQHIFAIEDGFVPRLSPSLELYINLPEAKEQALSTAFAQNFSEERCLARLEHEPFWMGGYALLAQHYAKLGHVEEALQQRLHLAQIAPLPKNMQAVIEAAKKAGDMALATNIALGLQDMYKEIQQKEALQRKAQALYKWAEETGDMALAQLFKQALEHI